MPLLIFPLLSLSFLSFEFTLYAQNRPEDSEKAWAFQHCLLVAVDCSLWVALPMLVQLSSDLKPVRELCSSYFYVFGYAFGLDEHKILIKGIISKRH